MRSGPGTQTIRFDPVGRRLPLEEGRTLLEAARQLLLVDDQSVYAPCGGKGTCGRCRVRVVEGQASPPTDAERTNLTSSQLEAGYRLSCQAVPLGSLRVEIPPDTLAGRQHLQVEGTPVPISPDPAVAHYALDLRPPSLGDPRPMSRQIEQFLASTRGEGNVTFDLDVVRELPALEAPAASTVAVRGSEIIGVRVDGASAPPLGLAVDLGTTKVAGYLVELETGALLEAEGLLNPQIPFGEDVMSRLAYALAHPDGLDRLGRLAAEAIGRLLDGLLVRAGAEGGRVEEVVVVANTAMHHLLARLPVGQLARAPYVPALHGPIELKARVLGLDTAPGAVVHLVPPIAGFVGGDHVAMILGAGIHEARDVILGLDIGTNTELVLAVDGQLTSCSCASGPAFEGAHLQHGMRAVDGAISRVRLSGDGQEVTWETVGGKAPVGLCGSGALDALAELVRGGVVNAHGRLDRAHPRVRDGEAGCHFVLARGAETGVGRDVVLSQRDIGELQLAKGAIASAVELLLRSAGIGADRVDRVVVAGAFGTHLSPQSAVTIGMFPDLPLECFKQVGNAAGTGARMALISRTARRLAAELAERVRYLELTSRPEFSRAFARALRFPVGSRGAASSGG